MADQRTIGNRLFPLRFLLFLALFLLFGAAGVHLMGWERGLLVAFDLAALVFILTELPWFRRSPAEMGRIATNNDANRFLLLLIALVITIVILAATTSMLTSKGELPLLDKLLVAGSLAMVWFFSNAIYALHYAHLYYLPGKSGAQGGLDFPGKQPPDFSDFVHFAFTIGVAVQTADIQITDRRIRRVVTLQAILGFFFNLFVLALTVNVLASGG